MDKYCTLEKNAANLEKCLKLEKVRLTWKNATGLEKCEQRCRTLAKIWQTKKNEAHLEKNAHHRRPKLRKRGIILF